MYNFGKQADIITFEIEAVNVDALERLQQEGKSVYPSPETLRKIQNKGDQKDFYSQQNIPTAPYVRYANLDALKLALTANQISFPFVWKSTTGGYDGKGVQVVRQQEDLDKIADVACIADRCLQWLRVPSF